MSSPFFRGDGGYGDRHNLSDQFSRHAQGVLVFERAGPRGQNLILVCKTPLQPGVTRVNKQIHFATRRLISPARTGTSPFSVRI